MQAAAADVSTDAGPPAPHFACTQSADDGLVTLQVANYLIDRLSKGTVTAELVQPDELISGMISQVAAEPEMGTLLSQFIYSTAGEPHSAFTGVVSPGLCCPGSFGPERKGQPAVVGRGSMLGTEFLHPK